MEGGAGSGQGRGAAPAEMGCELLVLGLAWMLGGDRDGEESAGLRTHFPAVTHCDVGRRRHAPGAGSQPGAGSRHPPAVSARGGALSLGRGLATPPAVSVSPGAGGRLSLPHPCGVGPGGGLAAPSRPVSPSATKERQ